MRSRHDLADADRLWPPNATLEASARPGANRAATNVHLLRLLLGGINLLQTKNPALWAAPHEVVPHDIVHKFTTQHQVAALIVWPHEHSVEAP